MFFPWPMYKRCAAKNNHRRLENKGELLTTSKWCSKCQQCNLPIIFAGRCSLQGQKSWPKCAFYWFFCNMMKNSVKYNKKQLFSPVGVPCRGKNPGQNVYFIDVGVNLCKIMKNNMKTHYFGRSVILAGAKFLANMCILWILL